MKARTREEVSRFLGRTGLEAQRAGSIKLLLLFFPTQCFRSPLSELMFSEKPSHTGKFFIFGLVREKEMFGIKQMVFISVTVKFMFEEKTEMYLFSIGRQHLGTLCFALVFA